VCCTNEKNEIDNRSMHHAQMMRKGDTHPWRLTRRQQHCSSSRRQPIYNQACLPPGASCLVEATEHRSTRGWKVPGGRRGRRVPLVQLKPAVALKKSQ
jgi:hypothetical protein